MRRRRLRFSSDLLRHLRPCSHQRLQFGSNLPLRHLRRLKQLRRSHPSKKGALAWLESLAADQGEELFNLDLSDLPAESVEPKRRAVSLSIPVNPMTWLEDLARSQVAEPSLEQLGAKTTTTKKNPRSSSLSPRASTRWNGWKRSPNGRARKQEELTTRASMNIPAPQEAEVEQDDYQPFSFDTLPARRSAEPAASKILPSGSSRWRARKATAKKACCATQKPD